MRRPAIITITTIGAAAAAAAALATTSPAQPAGPPTGELHLVGRAGVGHPRRQPAQTAWPTPPALARRRAGPDREGLRPRERRPDRPQPDRLHRHRRAPRPAPMHRHGRPPTGRDRRPGRWPAAVRRHRRHRGVRRRTGHARRQRARRAHRRHRALRKLARGEEGPPDRRALRNPSQAPPETSASRAHPPDCSVCGRQHPRRRRSPPCIGAAPRQVSPKKRLLSHDSERLRRQVPDARSGRDGGARAAVERTLAPSRRCERGQAAVGALGRRLWLVP